MEDIFGVQRLGSERSRETFAQPRMGIVSSSDSGIAAARVLLQPEGVLTGWLPVLTQWAGAGWGMSCPLNPGDQVLIIPQEGDSQHGLIVGRVFSNQVRPPQAELGELNLRHQSGCSIRLLNTGIVSVNGDLQVSGDVSDTHGSLSKLRNDYNVHIHHTSSGDTSIPLPLD
jgi:phage baseplate assembly protein V